MTTDGNNWPRRTRTRFAFIYLVPVWLAVSSASFAGPADGQAVYDAHCASCHDNPQGRTPTVAALRALSPSAILDVLENGVMKLQAASLDPADKKAVALYLGAAPKQESPAIGQCSIGDRPKPEFAAKAEWASWGLNLANTRFQTAEGAGLGSRDVPTLRLKWAFNLGEDAEPRSQPAVVNGTVFVGARKLYALSAASGCTRWVFTPEVSVRSGLTIAPGARGEPTVFFGDQRGFLYAVNAANGSLEWKVRVDSYYAAMVTGTPVVYKGVVYVGVSSYEEVMAASAQYPCCRFRGSVVALNATTGGQIWKTYTIAEPAQPLAGTKSIGPSGAAIWSSPTIDAQLQRIYVSTGDNYSDPPTATSDAVLALDLQSGKLLWTQQATSGDIYNVGCDPGVNGACPPKHGNDFDFGQPPILMSLPGGKRALVIAQKSGIVYGFDPDQSGAPLWKRKIGEGGALGGSQWGSAAAGGRLYVAISDIRLKAVPDKSEKLGFRFDADGEAGGGLYALDAAIGELVWTAKARSCGARKQCSPAQSGAVSGIPGFIFSGSVDGHIRAYSAATGSVVWDADTETEFTAVNGGETRGGSLDVAGPVIAGGVLYVMSGYSRYGGKPGNVLLAYSPSGR